VAKHYQFIIILLALHNYFSLQAQSVSLINKESMFCANLNETNRLDELNNKREIEKAIREINQFALSDSLWKMWQAINDSQFVIPHKDSTGALRKLSSGSQRVKRAVDMLHQAEGQSQDTLEVNRVRLNAILEMEKARVDLEESIRLNPYDYRTQKWLIWVFQSLADLHTDRGDYQRSTTMLEYLAHILKDDDQLYFKLGENYLWLHEWEKAIASLQQSINLILESEWESINTDELFSHFTMRAEAEIKLGLVSKALSTLNYAKLIAPNPDEERKIQLKTDWINWDDGNLENSKKHDELKTKYASCNDYNQLKDEFLMLYDQVSTNHAKNEIQWQIAKLEFQNLNNKTQAIERLFTIIKNIPTDSSGLATEPNFEKFLFDYGKMCYNLGVEYLNVDDYKLAYIYFTQSIAFHWPNIGKSYLQLACLSSINNDVTIDLCNKAIEYKDTLSLTEIQKVYELLFNAYKRKGDFNKAEPWYRKLASLQ